MHNILAEKLGFDLGHQGRASAIADPKLLPGHKPQVTVEQID